jgi:NAD(P)-dependent dehydrogenase (short-subunit alcohol dehydrogenase family)
MNQFGTPEKVAQLVDVSASDHAAFITGALHFVDGGVTAAI